MNYIMKKFVASAVKRAKLEAKDSEVSQNLIYSKLIEEVASACTEILERRIVSSRDLEVSQYNRGWVDGRLTAAKYINKFIL